MVSPSRMEVLVHDSISGHLLLLSPNYRQITVLFTFVLVQTLLIHPGLIKSLHLLETTTSVPLLFQDLTLHLLRCMLMILCGMVRDVVLLMPAVNSTTRHGSAHHYHNLLMMILNYGFALIKIQQMKTSLFPWWIYNVM